MVDRELFPEQLGKMFERGDVAIRKPTKSLQGCVCECTHEHLAIDNIYTPKNNHLGIERREMISKVFYPRENHLGRDVVWWHKLIHDRLREWLRTSFQGHIQISLPCGALIMLLYMLE